MRGHELALIALYRQCFNRQGRSAKFLSDNAFAVYLFHPPVIIALAILLHPVAAPPLVKAALLTACAAVVPSRCRRWCSAGSHLSRIYKAA